MSVQALLVRALPEQALVLRLLVPLALVLQALLAPVLRALLALLVVNCHTPQPEQQSPIIVRIWATIFV